MSKAHGDSLTKNAVVPENRISADHDSSSVLDDKTISDDCFTRQVDAEKHVGKELQQFVAKREGHTYGTERDSVSPPSKSVYHQRPEAMLVPSSIVSAPVLLDVLQHRVTKDSRKAGKNPCRFAAETGSRDSIGG